MTDADLVCRARGGDAEAWRTLYQRYLPAVWRQAYALVADVHAAADGLIRHNPGNRTPPGVRFVRFVYFVYFVYAAADGLIWPKTSSKVSARAASRSARVTGRPRSTSDVTPWSAMPQGMIPA